MVKFFRPKKYTRKGSRSVARRSGAKKVVRPSFRQKVLSVINKVSEKKKVSYNNNANQGVAQVYGNTDGWNCIDMSLLPAQGTANNQRLGAEVSLHSLNFRMQFYQMSATYQPIKLRYHLVWVKGGDQSLTTTQFMNEFLSVNPFSVHRDYNSSRNSDYMTVFRVLRSGYTTLPADPGSQVSQLTLRDVRLGAKFKKPLTIRYNANLNSVAQGKIFLVVLADSGNYSTTTANTEATLAVPVKEINTGAGFNYFIDYYYTDM